MQTAVRTCVAHIRTVQTSHQVRANPRSAHGQAQRPLPPYCTCCTDLVLHIEHTEVPHSCDELLKEDLVLHVFAVPEK